MDKSEPLMDVYVRASSLHNQDINVLDNDHIILMSSSSCLVPWFSVTQGVTIPSQLRYIRYYEQFLESRTLNYDPRLLVLQELVIDTIPKPLMNVEASSKYLILTIMSSDVKIYESVPQHVCYTLPSSIFQHSMFCVQLLILFLFSAK
jgi:hypothetical protein